jgi:spermidine/putrescine transport system substrate-binding protein
MKQCTQQSRQQSRQQSVPRPVVRWLSRIALGVAALGAIIGANSLAQNNTLNLFIWSEYIDPAIIKSFEQKFKAKVNISLYESNDDLLAKLKAGGNKQYDIIVPSDFVIPLLVKQKLLQPINKTVVVNLKNLGLSFLNPAYDPGNTYTAAYQWGFVGLIYRTDKLKTPPKSWSVLFDPKVQQGPFVLMDSLREMIGVTLKYLGKSANTINTADLKAATDALSNAKNRSLGFDGGVGGKNKVLAKQANYAVVYNGDAIKATEQDKNVAFVVPSEGSMYFLDSMAIPSGAPNPKLANEFINFILDAKIGAQLSNYNRYASPNAASRPFITPADSKNPAIYPSDATMKKLELVNDLGANTKLYDSVWTKVKSK